MAGAFCYVNTGGRDMQKYTAEMEPEKIREFEIYLYERENAEATIKKYMTDIKTFFRYLGDDLRIDKKKIMDYKKRLL